MARITVEDCLDKVDNRFALIHLAAKRVRNLRKGDEPLVDCKNEDIVTSLREIAGGSIYQVKKPQGDLLPEGTETEAPPALPEQSAEAASEAAETSPEAAETSPEAAETPPEAAETPPEAAGTPPEAAREKKA